MGLCHWHGNMKGKGSEKVVLKEGWPLIMFAWSHRELHSVLLPTNVFATGQNLFKCFLFWQAAYAVRWCCLHTYSWHEVVFVVFFRLVDTKLMASTHPFRVSHSLLTFIFPWASHIWDLHFHYFEVTLTGPSQPTGFTYNINYVSEAHVPFYCCLFLSF